jgi:hypothetical protein
LIFSQIINPHAICNVGEILVPKAPGFFAQAVKLLQIHGLMADC